MLNYNLKLIKKKKLKKMNNHTALLEIINKFDSPVITNNPNLLKKSELNSAYMMLHTLTRELCAEIIKHPAVDTKDITSKLKALKSKNKQLINSLKQNRSSSSTVSELKLELENSINRLKVIQAEYENLSNKYTESVEDLESGQTEYKKLYNKFVEIYDINKKLELENTELKTKLEPSAITNFWINIKTKTIALWNTMKHWAN